MHQLLERLLCATPDHHRGPRRVVVRAAVPRFVRLTVVLASIATLTVAVFQYRGASQYGVTIPTTPVSTRVDEWTQTPWGPLGPADRDLLVKISQAGLYEGASGQRAQRQAGSAQIRTMGMRISTECGDLDTQARSVAGQLGVVLSNQPTEQQQGWMTELSRLSGAVFDRTFTQRLRHEHGDILQAIVDVRAGTRNDLIRSFAVAASVLVNRHMDYLERTGLVDYSTLPEPPPRAANIALANREQRVDQVVRANPVNAHPANGPDVMVAAVVYRVAALLGIVGLLSLLGSAGLRVRRASGSPVRPRHAARRW